MEDLIVQFSEDLNLNYDEQEKIRDLIAKHGGVNWKDALGYSQVKSKLVLVEELKKIIKPESTVVVIGGWIGLIPYLMNLKNLKCKKVINVEIDQIALAASDFLNSDTTFSYEILFEDALNLNYSNFENLIVINTSCEHFSSYPQWMSLIPAGTPCILQSNNMFDLEEHVNCHKDLSDFVDNCGLSSVLTEEVIDIGDNWNRFMIRGIR